MLFTELCEKEVVDMAGGVRLGYVDDLVLDEKTARISELVLVGKGPALRLFGREESLRVPWSAIRRLGRTPFWSRAPASRPGGEPEEGAAKSGGARRSAPFFQPPAPFFQALRAAEKNSKKLHKPLAKARGLLYNRQDCEDML